MNNAHSRAEVCTVYVRYHAALRICLLRNIATMDPTAKGWLSWFREYLWFSSRPPPLPAVPTSPQHGSFFPFVGRGDSKGRAVAVAVAVEVDLPAPTPNPTQPTRGKEDMPRTRASRGARSSGDAEASTVERRRRASLRPDRKTRDQEKELRRRELLHVTLVWTFLREAEGWTFLKNTWDVCGPQPRGAVGGASDGLRQRAGPMSQAQVCVGRRTRVLNRFGF